MATGTPIASLYAKIGADVSGLQRGLKQAKGELRTTKTEFDSLLRTAGFVAAGLTAVGYATKKAFDFTKQGAGLLYTADKFDRLALSIGTTSDALRKDLKQATRGMMSDAELMASATDLMSLGLTKTEEQTVRLTRAAAALNMDMNQLVLALTNQTTARFDQLNVSVDGFDERLKTLEDTGMSTNDAFTEAFLQQAEAQILKVGEAADSAIGSFIQLETEWKNLIDYTKQMPSIQDLFGETGGITDAIAGLAQYQQAMNLLDIALKEGVITGGEYLEIQTRIQLTSFTSADAMEWLTAKQQGLTVEQWQAVQAGQAVDATLSAETVRVGMLGKSALNAMAEVGGLKQSLLDLQGVYTAIIRVVTQNVSAGFLEANPELRRGMTYLYNQNPGLFQYEMGDNWRPDYQLPQINYSSGGYGGGGGGGAGGGMAQAAPPPWAAPMGVASAMGSLASIASRRYEESIVDPLRDAVDASDEQIERQKKLVDMLRAMPKDIGTNNALVTAQERLTELEQERAKAAEELERSQERILHLQEQQQNLDFLQAQIRLLDTISEHGLNAGEILGGLQLGIEADMEDILDAMSNAMQQLIEQAEDDLGIASPSKVFQGIGINIVKGLAQGINVTQPVDAAMNKLFGVDLASSYAPSLLAPGGGGNITIEFKVASPLDVQDTAYQVAKILQEKLG